MDRGFILIDDEFVCYRRNYFQISAGFTLGSENDLYLEAEGQTLAIHQFTISIDARVDNGTNAIGLIQLTPKRAKGPQTRPVPQVVRPGGNPFAALTSDDTVVTFERVQFNRSTSNNGKKRKDLQQYTYLVLSLNAQTARGEYTISKAESAPLIVRGRSPAFYEKASPKTIILREPLNEGGESQNSYSPRTIDENFHEIENNASCMNYQHCAPHYNSAITIGKLNLPAIQIPQSSYDYTFSPTHSQTPLSAASIDFLPSPAFQSDFLNRHRDDINKMPLPKEEDIRYVLENDLRNLSEADS